MNDIVPVVEGEVIEFTDTRDYYEEAWIGLMSEITQSTARVYEPIIRDFIKWWMKDKHQPPAIALATFLHDQKEQGLAHRTLNKKRSALRRWFEWLAALDFIKHEDLLKVKQVKGYKVRGRSRAKWLNLKQMQRVFSAPLDREDVHPSIIKRDRAVLAVLMGCGLRRSEVTDLTWNQLEEYGAKHVFVNVDRKAHNRQAYISVGDWVYDTLMEWKEVGQPEETDLIFTAVYKDGSTSESLSDQRIYDIVKYYSESVGYDISPHDLRRSYAREAKRNGADISQIQLMLGHSNQKTTERYINEMMEVEKAAEFVQLEL